MALNTGENEQGLRKVIDLTRVMSIAILLLHVYYYCYHAFFYWKLTSAISDRLLHKLTNTGLFSSFYKSKLLALSALFLSLLGVRGKKSESVRFRYAFIPLGCGLLLYFGSDIAFILSMNFESVAMIYIVTMTIGYILIITEGGLLTRIIKLNLSEDVFNTDNQTFPQEERCLKNEYSIKLPALYNFKGNKRKSWINIINPMRGLLIMGSPGAGKSFLLFNTSSGSILKRASACLFRTLNTTTFPG